MTSTVTIRELQVDAPRVIRQAERQGRVNVTRHGNLVAFILSKDRLEALLESMEIAANPAAMKTLNAYRAGKLEMKDISWLVGFQRLRVTFCRVIYCERSEEGCRIIDCVFAERRAIVYDLFLDLLRDQLGVIWPLTALADHHRPQAEPCIFWDRYSSGILVRVFGVFRGFAQRDYAPTNYREDLWRSKDRGADGACRIGILDPA
jgi:antitoxin (DNA-binding transcriptional repressor) of toxin-antitoxin stability system